MTKLNPARKALLLRLDRANDEVPFKLLSVGERLAAINVHQEGLVTWKIDGRKLAITDAGRAALKEGTQ